jgi:hypothetical protein
MKNFKNFLNNGLIRFHEPVSDSPGVTRPDKFAAGASGGEIIDNTPPIIREVLHAASGRTIISTNQPGGFALINPSHEVNPGITSMGFQSFGDGKNAKPQYPLPRWNKLLADLNSRRAQDGRSFQEPDGPIPEAVLFSPA